MYQAQRAPDSTSHVLSDTTIKRYVVEIDILKRY